MPLPDSVRVNIEVFGDINVGPTFLVQANSLFTNIGLSLRIGMAEVQFIGFLGVNLLVFILIIIA